MSRYIIKRICFSLLTIWILVTLTFLLMHLMPGDPFISTKAVDPEVKAMMFKKYGLDKPLIVQYFIYLGKMLRGDLGISLHYKGAEVVDRVFAAFPYSFELGMRSLIIGISLGLTFGIVAAKRNGKLSDGLIMGIAVIGISVPSFIMAALLNYGVGLKFGTFLKDIFGLRSNPIPISGWGKEASKWLPAIALSFGSLASIARLMRASTMDVLNADYIKTAKAKGLSESQITRHHMMRNAILPVVTILGPTAAAILTGAFVVESVFAIPGMGKFFVLSIQVLDYPMIVGTTVIYGVLLIVMNTLVDIVYGIVDPRIRLERKGVSA